jgi:sulfide:quinone oxidoreductase
MIESQGTAAVKNIRNMIDHAEKLHRHRQHQQDIEGGDASSSSSSSSSVSPSDAVELRNRPLLNGVCITDFGHDNGGAIFLTLPQYPPRRTDITIERKIATLAKIGFEKYFLHKIESGDTDPYYEKYMLHLIGVDRVTSKPQQSSATTMPTTPSSKS